jgi:hypothetical protein
MSANSDDASSTGQHPTEAITEPAKLLRLTTMVRQVLEELRRDGFGEATRARLDAIHHTFLRELEGVLSDDLRDELDRLVRPLVGEPMPSESELRLAEAQLLGWLEGLFQGVQVSVLAAEAAQVQARQRQTEQQELDRPSTSYL